MSKGMTRREVLHFVGIGAVAALLAACRPKEVERIVKETVEVEKVVEKVVKETVEVEKVVEKEVEKEIIRAVAVGDDKGILRPPGHPKRGGTLRTAFGANITNNEPGGSVKGHMYSDLLTRNNLDGLRSIVGDLAHRWEVSDDGLTWTFYLREGVKFHDGALLTADDVVATYSRICWPPDHIVMAARDNYRMVESIEAVDDLTVVFKLTTPCSYFEELLCDGYVVRKKTLEDNNYDLRMAEVPPGTGAFRFVRNIQGDRYIIERNPDYWDPELPYIDGIEFLNVPSWADRGTAVLTDRADFTWNCSIDTYDAGLNRPDIVQVNRVPINDAYWMYFNCEHAPFDDPLVRRAINLGINRHNLMRAFSTQEWMVLTRWIVSGSCGATPEGVTPTLPGYRQDNAEDIAEARRLLEQAGHGGGIKGVDFLCASGPQGELLGPAMQAMLRNDLGIEANIRLVERDFLIEDQREGNFDLMIQTGVHAVWDFSPLANIRWRTGTSQNYTRYSNPDLDALIDEIDAEVDMDKRCALVAKALDFLDQDPPMFLIAYTMHNLMWRNEVKGVGFDIRSKSYWGRTTTVWLDK